MGNLTKLKSTIEQAGIKKRHLACQLGISHQALYNKLSGKTEFIGSELTKLCTLLTIDDQARREIFFA